MSKTKDSRRNTRRSSKLQTGDLVSEVQHGTGLREEFALSGAIPYPNNPRAHDLRHFEINAETIKPHIIKADESIDDWQKRLQAHLDGIWTDADAESPDANQDYTKQKREYWEELFLLAVDGKKNGFRDTIEIDSKTNHIVGGERRYWAARLGRITHLKANITDNDPSTMVNRAFLSNRMHQNPTDVGTYQSCKEMIALHVDPDGNPYKAPDNLPSLDKFLEITTLKHTVGNQFRALLKLPADHPVIEGFLSYKMSRKQAFTALQDYKKTQRTAEQAIDPSTTVVETEKTAPKAKGRKVSTFKIKPVRSRDAVLKILALFEDQGDEAVSELIEISNDLPDDEFFAKANSSVASIIANWDKAE